MENQVIPQETPAPNNKKEQSADNDNPAPKKKSKIEKLVLLLILLVAVGAGAWWWINYNKYITSDDANLDSYRIDVAAQISGRITRQLVEEGDTVKKGDVLFEIDNASMISRKLQAEAEYQQLEAQLEVAKIDVTIARKAYEVAVLAEGLSRENYNRSKAQYSGDAIPLETLQTMEENWKSSKLQVEIAQNRIKVAQASIEVTKRQAEASQANISTLDTDLSYYQVVAPSDGVIAKRWCLPGDIINAGQTIFTLNIGSGIWVAVYLEETKFSNIYIGQEAKFTLDAYDKLTFYGRIYYIGDNAASEFSLVPPNNASGNYTKVTQRIPLKISIDKVDGDKEQKSKLKLVSGMSAEIHIIKK